MWWAASPLALTQTADVNVSVETETLVTPPEELFLLISSCKMRMSLWALWTDRLPCGILEWMYLDFWREALMCILNPRLCKPERISFPKSYWQVLKYIRNTSGDWKILEGSDKVKFISAPWPGKHNLSLCTWCSKHMYEGELSLKWWVAPLKKLLAPVKISL